MLRRRRFSLIPVQILSPLEQLPAEVLTRVFDRVADHNGPYCWRTVSRALRPYFERNLYRRISIITGYWTFRRLCQCLYHSPHLAQHIKELTVIEGPFSNSSTFEHDDEEYIFRFFQAATSLKSIWLCLTLNRLESRILSAKYAAHCFASLESLHLSPATAVSEPSFFRDARYLGWIGRLRELKLSFTVNPNGDPDASELTVFSEQDRLIVAGRQGGE